MRPLGNAAGSNVVNLSAVNYFALILCLMVGTASLPHVLMRYFTIAGLASPEEFAC